MIDRQEKYKAVLCTIKGTSLQGLWRRYRSRLFNYNIRGFLGENAINKSMKHTLENDPEKFYFYNNGISAICTEITPYPGDGEIRTLRCKDFSIINGAQTTATIGKFKNVEKLKQVQVLLKLTKAEDYKKEKGLNKRIITYNNSQTVVKISDFRANDPIQMFLDNKLSNFIYKGTAPHQRLCYLRKRLKVDRKRDTVYLPLETFARVLYAFDHDPAQIFKGTKQLFDPETDGNGKYWLLFGEDGKEVDGYGNKRLERMTAIYFIWLRVEQQIKGLMKAYLLKESDTVKYQSLLAKWHFLWAYGYVLQTFYTEQVEAIYKKISSGLLFEEKVTFIERWFPKIHNTLSKCIERNYNDTNKSSTDISSFNFKNWMRSSSDFEEVVREFKYMDKSDFIL